MSVVKKIRNAFISTYNKDGLDEILIKLNEEGVKLYSTSGTQIFIASLGIPCFSAENLTGYPSILGGRVKTLHPKVFGGILARRNDDEDIEQMHKYNIPEIDLVIVDLYPFQTVITLDAQEQEIIEKIDIGGISLIRAAAKNFQDVVVVASKFQYTTLIKLLNKQGACSSIEERKWFAKEAFAVSSEYDSAIFNYFDESKNTYFRKAYNSTKTLRYGENPHQNGFFYGDLDSIIDKLHGKEVSYNNLLDIDAAIDLISEFNELTFAILKHNNACGVASRFSLLDAWQAALSGDPISAFGGILICNRQIDKFVATEIDKIYFEVIIAPSYESKALEILKQKKNRIILVQKQNSEITMQFRSIFNGVLLQDKDMNIQTENDLKVVTSIVPSKEEIEDLLFANKLVKHTKSNAIVLAKNKQLYASGAGQTSRVDALRHAIRKANDFHFDLNGSVMASDAFFPFHDCVKIASKAGIKAIIQPGGSINDNSSIKYCNRFEVSMVFTGIRHFRH
ncbi:MAG: bifunctional phosphoribosylaminoimidazolecarboxamide formyltransferase/IMP cyclohydrolase [Bacteroidales bacterium OttesenSCG-928-I14]|jgi:phosphoribosylaminoimidazolecarboxamide formyltransferase/IMP cyclohydrolase|nr:bifunctional phosphoribosylaminoimidazolecarboxamide formyltransferase/IMP cyclohydrolase [Bacteroidales bacterium OttesenSCG-928-I14]